MTATNGKAKPRPGAEQQRQNILDAAVELFSTQGAKVSVQDICKRANVSRDTYYRCFADKDALLRHLYQTTVSDHIEQVHKAWDMDFNDHAWLRKVCDRVVDAILEQHQLAQFLFIESADPTSSAYSIVSEAYRRVVRRIQRWCMGEYGAQPSAELLTSLLIAAQWLVHNAIIKGMTKAEVKKAKQALEDLFFAVFANLQRDAEVRSTS